MHQKESMKLKKLHHIAVICSDYDRSKDFYTRILSLDVLSEHFREERQSWKLDLSLNGEYLIELFSFPNPPARPGYPEAAGARHIAFSVESVEEAVSDLRSNHVEVEAIRTDPMTGKKFTFFKDPDGLPLELYEI